MTITYHKDGTKTVTLGKRKPSYESVTEKPFHQRVLDAYYKLECNHQLTASDFSEFGGKARVAELHKREL